MSTVPNPFFDLKPQLQELAGFAGLRLTIKRDDLIHPGISGNKWYKLLLNAEEAKRLNKTQLVSFGGAWSNHLHALATYGSEHNIATAGIVRGEEVLGQPSATLKDCLNMGMTLIPVTRERYRQRGYLEPSEWLEVPNLTSSYFIPEGGSNELGIEGCSHILDGINQSEFDYIAVAVGTGATLKGILSATEIPVFAVQVVKDNSVFASINQLKKPLLWGPTDQLGRYGKASVALQDFILHFEAQYKVPLDPIYTGKLLFSLQQAAKAGTLAASSRVLMIHSGGLQGRRGFNF